MNLRDNVDRAFAIIEFPSTPVQCVYALHGVRKSLPYDTFCDWLGHAPDPRIFLVPNDIQ